MFTLWECFGFILYLVCVLLYTEVPMAQQFSFIIITRAVHNQLGILAPACPADFVSNVKSAFSWLYFRSMFLAIKLESLLLEQS